MAAFMSLVQQVGNTSDRRTTDRFPIVRELRYRIPSSRGQANWGTGRTVDISSCGILFAAEAPLPAGRRVELAISWPAHLDGRCALKLVARGRVSRCRGNEVAVEIEKYEFRTQGAKGLAPQAQVC